jgi:hypothetical protein
LATNLTKLLNQYGLRKKKFTYVKDEGSNLTTMITALKSIVTCEILGLDESFPSTCFGHVFLRRVSMLQLMLRFVKTINLFLSNLRS